jgi:excisionase family DNA binding protein
MSSLLKMPRRETIVPDDAILQRAREAAMALEDAEDQGNGRSAVEASTPVGKKTLLFPSEVLPLVVNILARLGMGEIVTVIPEGAELTIPEAADILDVSKPFVVGLLDRGEIPSQGDGAFRRVIYRDLLAYKARSDAECRAAADEMAGLSQGMGLY